MLNLLNSLVIYSYFKNYSLKCIAFILYITIVFQTLYSQKNSDSKGINAMMGYTPVYNLEMTMKSCKVMATFNSLPLVNLDAKSGASFGSPLNSKLVGRDNKLVIIVMPTMLESGEISKVSDVLLFGTIKVYGIDDVATPENGTLVEKFDIKEVIAERKRNFIFDNKNINSMNELSVSFPLELKINFDNSGPSFIDRLLQSSIINDDNKILDYAEFLRDLMKNHQIDKLFNEFRPKFDDYNIAYNRGNLDRQPVFIEYLKEKFFPSGPLLDFERDDIGLQVWCEGRVWEIFVKPKRAFFTTAGLDGNICELEIFVGMVNGELKVIR